MSTTLITSRDPKGLHAVRLFEVVYDKTGLDEDRAQRLNEHGGELQDGIAKLIMGLTTPDQYINEEVRSNYAYPSEYMGPKPIDVQIKALAKILDLDAGQALKFVKNLPKLPEGAEGWFAIPCVSALAKKHFPVMTDSAQKYCMAVQLIHEKISASRRFYNYREGQIVLNRLRVNARTLSVLDQIAEAQKSEILIIAAQLGLRHRGRSVRRAREVFIASEFGLGSVMVGSIILTHPERLVRWEELDMDCSGDEFAPDGDGGFSHAPCFRFHGGGVGFDTERVCDAYDGYGTASGFLPQ